MLFMLFSKLFILSATEKTLMNSKYKISSKIAYYVNISCTKYCLINEKCVQILGILYDFGSPFFGIITHTYTYTYTFRIAAHTHSFSQNVINGVSKDFPSAAGIQNKLLVKKITG